MGAKWVVSRLLTTVRSLRTSVAVRQSVQLCERFWTSFLLSCLLSSGGRSPTSAVILAEVHANTPLALEARQR